MSVVIFDPRGHQKIMRYVSEMGIEPIVTQLDCGDVMIDGRISLIFEIKSAEDLLNAVKSGRFFEQSAKMLSMEYGYPVLIIYGAISRQGEDEVKTFKGTYPDTSFYGLIMALFSMSVHGLSILPILPSERDVAKVLLLASKWADKEQHISALRRQKEAAFGSKEYLEAIHILTGIDRIGPSTAHDLLEHFGSVLAIAEASKEELCQVKGISKVTANRIWNAFRRKLSSPEQS